MVKIISKKIAFIVLLSISLSNNKAAASSCAKMTDDNDLTTISTQTTIREDQPLDDNNIVEYSTIKQKKAEELISRYQEELDGFDADSLDHFDNIHITMSPINDQVFNYINDFLRESEIQTLNLQQVKKAISSASNLAENSSHRQIFNEILTLGDDNEDLGVHLKSLTTFAVRFHPDKLGTWFDCWSKNMLYHDDAPVQELLSGLKYGMYDALSLLENENINRIFNYLYAKELQGRHNLFLENLKNFYFTSTKDQSFYNLIELFKAQGMTKDSSPEMARQSFMGFAMVIMQAFDLVEHGKSGRILIQTANNVVANFERIKNYLPENS